MRDLRDMLISRYFHILSDKDHWLHKTIKDLDFLQKALSIRSKPSLTKTHQML